MNEVYNLFPTPIIRVGATEENYIPVQIEIKNAIDDILNNSDSSSLSYLSNDVKATSISKKTYNFIEKFNCKNLEKRIYAAVNEYLNSIGWQGDSEFVIKNSWINLTDKGNSHGHHCHPGYTISGTYYFRVSEEQGCISFNNPNPAMMHCQFPQSQASPQTVDIVPDDGDILLFPSWLMHTTRVNESNEQRVSVAFNLDYNGRDDVVLGLVKRSNIPFHKKEWSLRGIFTKHEN